MTRVRRWLSGGLTVMAVAAVTAVGVPAPAYAQTSGRLPYWAPIREMQWYLDALRIPDAQKITRGGGVVVGLIESSGADASHRDLAGQILPGRGFGSLAGTDGRQNTSKIGHGTHMAGIIAAKGGAPGRALGIAPEAKILPVPFGANPSPDTVASAIRWAVDNGAKVLNMSFGVPEPSGPTYKTRMAEAVKYALDRNVVVVAGSGNTELEDGTSHSAQDVLTPGDIPGVVTVGATGKKAERLSTSVYGPEVVLAAPGEQIAGPVPIALAASGYANGGYTSSATAIVSGVAALIRSRYPDMDVKNVVNRLIATARDQGAPGRDLYTGFGTVRPINALTDNVAAVTAWPLPTPQPSAPTTRPGAEDTEGGGPGVGLWLVAAGCVLAVVAVVAILVTVLLVSRARRRSRLEAGAMR